MGRRCLTQAEKIASKERRRKIDAERKRKQREVKKQAEEEKKKAKTEFATNSTAEIEEASEKILQATVTTRRVTEHKNMANTKKLSEEESVPPPVSFEHSDAPSKEETSCLREKEEYPVVSMKEHTGCLKENEELKAIVRHLKEKLQQHSAAPSKEETRCLREKTECAGALKREKIKYLKLQEEMRKYPAIAPKEQTSCLKEIEQLKGIIRYLEEKLQKPETQDKGTDVQEQDFYLFHHKNRKNDDLDEDKELEIICFKPPPTKKGKRIRERRLPVRNDTGPFELLDLTVEEPPINHPSSSTFQVAPITLNHPVPITEGLTFNWRNNIKQEDQPLAIRSTVDLEDEEAPVIPIIHNNPSSLNLYQARAGAPEVPNINLRTNLKLENPPLRATYHPPRTVSEYPVYYSGISSGGAFPVGAVPTGMYRNVSSSIMTAPQEELLQLSQRSQISLHPTHFPGHLETAPQEGLLQMSLHPTHFPGHLEM